MNRIIVFVIGCLFFHQITFTQTPANDPHWRLKWEDHFDNLNLFNQKWAASHYCGNINDAPVLSLESNVSLSNSNLVIEINNIPVECPSNPPHSLYYTCGDCAKGDYTYRSGCVMTQHPYNTQYGYIEARMKLPWRRENGKTWGIAPNFWLWRGEQIAPPKNATEIDIFEVFAHDYKEPNTLNTCIHTCYSDTLLPPMSYYECKESYGIKHELSNFDFTQWHTYGLEWNFEKIVWYVDGKVIRTLVNRGDNIYYPIIVDPVKIIIGIALDKKRLPPTSPTFREYMYVDYVRVYSLQCDKNTVINEIANFNTYNYAVKKSITMSNATTIPAGSNISLRATDFIELKPGFEVPAGRELYLDVTPCGGSEIACVDNLTNQTITSNTTVTGCNILNVKDVNILNSATVGITAGEKVNIQHGFHATAGTNVKVKIEQ